MAKRLLTEPNREHEQVLWNRGFSWVAGVDEVGRGSWAGPVVAAAVVLPQKAKLLGVRDSKLLSKPQRQKLARDIKQTALAIGVGWASPAEIDEIGLAMALQRAAQRALAGLEVDAVLLDGQHNYLPGEFVVSTVVKGDQNCLNIAAASIIAKVARDNYMAKLHRLYPEFGFDSNVGYGTKRHAEGLTRFISPLHRRSFAPVKLAASGVN